LKDAQFHITPPAYTGQKPQTIAGPPAALIALPNSLVEVSFTPETAIRAADWVKDGSPAHFKSSGGRWTAEFLLTNAGTYKIETAYASEGKPSVLARGESRFRHRGSQPHGATG
jgi:hypothetical protein